MPVDELYHVCNVVRAVSAREMATLSADTHVARSKGAKSDRGEGDIFELGNGG